MFEWKPFPRVHAAPDWRRLEAEYSSDNNESQSEQRSHHQATDSFLCNHGIALDLCLGEFRHTIKIQIVIYSCSFSWRYVLGCNTEKVRTWFLQTCVQNSSDRFLCYPCGLAHLSIAGLDVQKMCALCCKLKASWRFNKQWQIEEQLSKAVSWPP